MIKNKIYDYFLKKEKDRPQPDEITFAPSYFSDCKRKIFYKKTGQEISDPISEAGYFKMALGSSSHEKIQSIIKELGILQEAEDLKTIEYGGLTFNYRLDGIVEIDGKKYVLEIKTIYGAGFRNVEEYGAKPEHMLQCRLYMEFEKVDRGLILYVGRDNGMMMEFVIERNGNEDIKKIINDLKILKNQIENKVLPDKDFKIQIKNTGEKLSEDFTKDKVKYKTDWHCGYCSYKSHCWKDVYSVIKNKKFYINGVFYDD
jgi:CRISPR/Cas system-associated exonuclease Cas4 (RecB family)